MTHTLLVLSNSLKGVKNLAKEHINGAKHRFTHCYLFEHNCMLTVHKTFLISIKANKLNKNNKTPSHIHTIPTALNQRHSV